jgi:membrane glycosyltransferase
VVVPLTLSIPISVYSSRVFLGRLLRRARLLRIPEESNPPEELRRARVHASEAGPAPGFVDAVVDPHVNAVACAVARVRVKGSPREESRRDRVVGEAVKLGPDGLSTAMKMFLLNDALALSQLHVQVRTSPAAHPGWLVANHAADGQLGRAS